MLQIRAKTFPYALELALIWLDEKIEAEERL